MQFLDFPKWEVHESLAQFQHDLIVAEYEGDLIVLPVDGLASYEFAVDQNGQLSFHHLILLYAQLLPTLLHLRSLVSAYLHCYLTSTYYSFAYFRCIASSFPPKLTTYIKKGLLLGRRSCWAISGWGRERSWPWSRRNF